MKIIQLISSSGFYGAEKVVLELCAHLYSGGHEVQLGVFVNQGQGEVALAAEASKLGVPVVPFPCRGRFDARTMGLIRQHVLTHRVDLAHSHGYKADIYTGLASLPQETIRVSTCHNWLTDSLKLMAFELLNKLVLHRFHQVVAVSLLKGLNAFLTLPGLLGNDTQDIGITQSGMPGNLSIFNSRHYQADNRTLYLIPSLHCLLKVIH